MTAGRAAGRSKVKQGDVVTIETLAPLFFSSEQEFQQWVEARAAERGWIAFHDRDSRKNIAGLPDNILIRERVVWMELKYGRGVLSRKQKIFLAALRAAGEEVHVCYPGDIPKILEVLA